MHQCLQTQKVAEGQEGMDERCQGHETSNPHKGKQQLDKIQHFQRVVKSVHLYVCAIAVHPLPVRKKFWLKVVLLILACDDTFKKKKIMNFHVIQFFSGILSHPTVDQPT